MRYVNVIHESEKYIAVVLQQNSGTLYLGYLTTSMVMRDLLEGGPSVNVLLIKVTSGFYLSVICAVMPSVRFDLLAL